MINTGITAGKADIMQWWEMWLLEEFFSFFFPENLQRCTSTYISHNLSQGMLHCLEYKRITKCETPKEGIYRNVSNISSLPSFSSSISYDFMKSLSWCTKGDCDLLKKGSKSCHLELSPSHRLTVVGWIGSRTEEK